MNYEYLLLLLQKVVVLEFQMPHLPLFFVAHIPHFASHSRRIARRLLSRLDGLLNGATRPFRLT
jgi:hypothetical protein